MNPSVMQTLFIQYVFLILIILGLVMLATRLKLAYPIVLVVGGLVLSFTAAFSNITINPELVFFLFLPPLLYEAAWQVSWKEFWRWRRVIMGFAFPVVIITSCVVAFAANAIIPGFTLALGFLLGGIVSPPDAVSATTIMRQVNVPKSLLSVIQGESLLNDASSLIVFRFALVAVVTGRLHFGEVATNFLLVVLVGSAIGLLVGVVFYAIHRWLPTTPGIDTVLTIITPYCMYYAAEHFHYSGVLSVVCGGLFLSSKRQTMLTYQSRIQGVNVWANLVFVLNGLVFLLIGLQLPSIAKQLGTISLGTAIWYGVAISLVLIIARFLCTFGTALFTKLMSRFITVADPNPGWKAPLISGWAGMRGVVSLAMALSIPLFISEGQPFPYRNLILFITFIVILVTLVLQGLTLPWLIRKVKLEDRFSPYSEEKQELIIQKKMAQASLQFLEDRFQGKEFTNEHVRNLYARLSLERKVVEQQVNEVSNTGDDALQDYQQVYFEMLETQRRLLNQVNQHSEFDEELIRKYLSLIDIEELRLRKKPVGQEEDAPSEEQ
jgi:CPA1 family monovalent cation:H+ antiporter